MHRKILKDASLEQLQTFVDKAIFKIKQIDNDLYNDLEICLYKEVYGCHFNRWLLEKALSEMVNEDGTKGGKWSLEETTSVAKANNIDFINFNEYDWCYVLNMIYSDYYGAVPNDVSVYCKMAKKFLEDKDASKGKAFYYYLMK